MDTIVDNKNMKNKISKSLILQAYIKQQHELIESFKHREAEMKKDVYSRNESTSQSEDRTAGKMDLLRALGNEYVFVQQEMAFLDSLEATKVNSVVEPGAIVVTDQITFFIGISSDKVEIDGATIFGISTKAPIYRSMEGLQKGNSFQFNETNYTIEEVY